MKAVNSHTYIFGVPAFLKKKTNKTTKTNQTNLFSYENFKFRDGLFSGES